MATSSNPIKFFDIASGPPRRTYAPNPWKTRYALNYKSVPYQTEWVELPDIEATRLAHRVAPVRKFPDDSDFYTLPMVYDAATDTYVGDSFDIAVYLDEQYPSSGRCLLPPGSIGVHRAFNAQVDALFTRHVGLGSQNFPFNPETAEQSKADFVARWNIPSWDAIIIKGDARLPLLEAFKADLEDFAKLYKFDSGPFLEGDKMSYADIVVGAWLSMIKMTLPEWDQLCEWQGGRWKRLIDALSPWAEVK
ncbi:glutathione S-transferase-like protein [Pyrenochaeta sp. MPI-SDFR-AT-0127]|nr:glutathione S-transferase-like protein [Pyrenochaeta sp. MPI-SDFR-AT-0127]